MDGAVGCSVAEQAFTATCEVIGLYAFSIGNPLIQELVRSLLGRILGQNRIGLVLVPNVGIRLPLSGSVVQDLGFQPATRSGVACFHFE